MIPAKTLMIETLMAVGQSPFRAAMIIHASGPAWGVWHHVYEVRWLCQPPNGYERSVADTGYWPSELAKAQQWATSHVAPPPFIDPCLHQDFYSEQTMMHDLRYFSSCPRVLERCPWLPERLAAVELLGELS